MPELTAGPYEASTTYFDVHASVYPKNGGYPNFESRQFIGNYRGNEWK
jgi:hypothetical protein